LGEDWAHLILVPNPQHNPKGDFALHHERLFNDGDITFTFSGIGYYSAKLFETQSYGKAALAPLLRKAISNDHIRGSLYSGRWYDIGTPQRLDAVNKELHD